MRWSTTLMPSSLPASTRRLVRARSSCDGCGDPDGWLWQHRSAAALLRIAGFMTSRGCTTLAVSDPIDTVLMPMTLLGFQAFWAENLLCALQPLTLLSLRQWVIKKGVGNPLNF